MLDSMIKTRVRPAQRQATLPNAILDAVRMRYAVPAVRQGNTRWKPRFYHGDHLRTYRPRHERRLDYNNDSRKLRITEAVCRGAVETAENWKRR